MSVKVERMYRVRLLVGERAYELSEEHVEDSLLKLALDMGVPNDVI